VPRRAWRQRVLDIIEAAERIIVLTRDLEFERFTSDPVLHDAVLYRLVVIGEAAGNVPAEVQARHSDVPWRDMREMRNFVAHVYHGVSDRRVWKTITRDLPLLVPSLRRILVDEPSDDADG
jgi:uncharacterized protein with HEPN domain